MAIDAAVARYGLVAVLLGSGIEGEPFAIAGGVLARRGAAPLWLAVLAAILGAVLVDQGWFALTRCARASRPVAAIRRRPAFSRAITSVERRPLRFLPAFRFAYGLRAVAPVAIGASRVPVTLFVACEVAAAIVWGTGFTLVGYAAGPLFGALSARYGSAVEAAAVALSLGVLIFALRGGGKARE